MTNKRQRKSLNPAFKFKYIKNLFPRFWFHATQLVRSLEKEIDEANAKRSATLPTVDIDGWLMRATLDIIAATGFGVNVNAIQAPDSALATVLPLSNSTSPQASFYMLLGYLLPEWLYLRLPMARRYELDQVVKALHDATMPLIRARKADLSKRTLLGPETEDSDTKSTAQDLAETDVIATLLRFPQKLTDQELLAQSASIMLAGQDTTSVATTWALYFMAHHPQIQARLRQEVRSSLPSPGSADGAVDASLVESLPYLAAVCSETLRLFPPVSILRREVVKAGTTILGEHIPIGTHVVTSIWGTHHTRSIWGQDVQAFRPDRFLQHTEDGKAKFDPHGGLQGETATYCFVPFGAGVRSCIGERFARGEFAILLAALVGKFDWTLMDPEAKLGEDVKINFGLVLKPQGGLFLHASKVEGWVSTALLASNSTDKEEATSHVKEDGTKTF
ncbi:cytochrome P450 [Exophiala viscosa]|uniref:Cytochrome P450 n=1 Tax=Exophiala viscosa TaxID=2486360 RepID=A0AAN6E3B2_9EURO|nr:cytochrome P450 [Exophiala viscosa]